MAGPVLHHDGAHAAPRRQACGLRPGELGLCLGLLTHHSIPWRCATYHTLLTLASTWYGSTLLGSTSQVVGGMDVVAAVEAVGTPSGQPTARVVIEDCGIEPEAKDSITASMPEY